MFKRRDEKGGDEAEDAKGSGETRPRRVRSGESTGNLFTSSESKQSGEGNNGGEEAAGAGGRPRRRRADDSKEDSAADGGNWMTTSTTTTGPGRRRAAQKEEAPAEDMAEDNDVGATSSKASANRKHFEEGGNDGEIVMIPDLEDETGIDGDSRVAHAPRNVNRKIPTLAELEEDAKAAMMIGESGLDLAVLLSTLVPQSTLTEADEVWTFESLLRDVTDELLPILNGSSSKETTSK